MPERLIAQLKHNLGPVIMQALNDPEVVEVMLNPDSTLWVERMGQPMQQAGCICPNQARVVLSVMASFLDTVVTIENPIVEGELPIDGSRFEGLLPPVVAGPSFTIRKKASKIFTLEQYVESEVMAPVVKEMLLDAISNCKNILVVGGTGSGKTTLVNGIIDGISELCPEDRLVIIEDTSELQSRSENTVFLRTSPYVTIQHLVRVTMRLRPDRILVGEVRGGEALDLLKSWNTGHPGGVATVHANSAAGGLIRLEQLIAEASMSPMQTLIGEAVNLVLYIERAPGKGRIVKELLQVNGFDPKNLAYSLEALYNV